MAVRGTFDLNERPATEALRRIQREGERTDVVLRKVGGSVDSLFDSKNVGEAKAYEERLGAAKEEAKDLGVALEAVSKIHAKPRVTVEGLDIALAKTELLARRLASLDRETVRPNVGVGPAALGGGGSSFGGGRGLKIPFAGAVPWPVIAGGLAAAPPLIGGAGALLGSAGGATLGAAALGATGLGVGATAGALTAPTAIVAGKDIAASSDALKKYREEVMQTGPSSKNSLAALRELNQALDAAPRGTRKFLAARTALGSEFGRATAPGQAAVAGIATRGINVGRQLTPQLGAASNRFLGEAQTQTNNFGNFLTDPRSKAFYEAMSKEATADLSNVEGISENALRSIENIARAGRPFFHEGIEFLERWTGGWKRSTNDLKGTREEIGSFVDDLKSWGKLGGSGVDLVGDLLGAGRKPGTGMVDDLTDQLKEWDRWVERNPRKVKAFFTDAVDSTEKIAGGVAQIGTALWKVGQNLSPLITQGTKLIDLLDSAGLLSPGGLPFLIAGGAGIRNSVGGARGRILGGGAAAGGMGMGMGAPLILGGGAAAPSRYPAARGLFGRVGATSYVPTTAAGAGGLTMGMEAEAGAIGSRQFSGRRMIGGVGREIGTLGAPRAAAFARGFGARIGPLMALSAGLGALTTEGNLGEKLQGGISQGTFGLFPGPLTYDQRVAHGYTDAQGGFGDALHRKRNAARHVFQGSYGRQFRGLIPAAAAEAGQSPAYFRFRQHHPLPLNYAVEQLRGADTASPGGKGEAAFYQEQISKIRGGQASRATGFTEDIRGAARIEMNHGVKGARASALDNIADRIGGINDPRTAKLFGNQGLGLAQQIARENPKLKSAVEQLGSTIEKRFEDMGQKVRIIHGRIVDVSASSWKQVADAAESESARALASSTKNLTALEKRAISILRNMGFSGSDARGLAESSLGVHGAKAEKAAGVVAGHGSAVPFSPGYIDKATGHALGGRLGGTGLHDTVNLGGGNMAAPGELLIPNRHTERRIDRALAMAGTGTTIAREIAMEGRGHSEPFRTFSATGSILPAAKMAQAMGLSVGEGPGFGGVPSSGHASGSLHYSGLAYDISGAANQMWAYRKRAESAFRSSINELFYDPYPYYIDQGRKVPGSIGGHSDHVHIGFMGGGAKGSIGGGRGMGRAAGHPRVNLKGQRSGIGGITGLIADRANQAVAGGMSQNLNKLIGGRGGGGGVGMPGHGGGSPAQNMALARQMMRGYGWGGGEWGPLKSLWTQESGWSQTARNPSSGAYGIPQSLPASKMGPEAQGGGAAAARAQIAWGLKYIQERYGSPSGAWAHEQSSNWYSLGGRPRQPGFAGWFGKGGHFRVKNPTMIGVGESGEETVKITPKGRGGGGGGRAPEINVSIGTVHVGNAGEARKVGRKLAQGMAAELAVALRRSDGVGEDEV